MEETIKTTTPVDKHEVVFKKWITGRDRRGIDSIYYGEIEVGLNQNNPEVKGLKGSTFNKAQDKTIETLVVSVDGKKENVVDAVLDMRAEDFDFVINKMNEITSKKKES
jgi:hypothetical protein